MQTKLKQPLHILIDGPDKVGKTTVIKLLSRSLDLPVIKMPNTKEYIEKGTVEEFSKFYNETLIQFTEFDFIMDRGFTSSKVYSEVFNRKSDLKYIQNIETILKPMVFILTSNSPLDDTEEVDQIKESFQEIRKSYIRLASENGYNIINVVGLSPTQICNEILQVITSSEEGSQD